MALLGKKSFDEVYRIKEKIREIGGDYSDIPNDANIDLENLDPTSLGYRCRIKNRLCSCCYEMATEVVSYDYQESKRKKRFPDKERNEDLSIL